MSVVGRVGTYIAQGVYTVSGPFHPFGGAVDIIVVEQEDGTFKSSPWYVKFGKFQGVLKRTEKRVAVAVNDGVASFHMYLDHKGEAYFLKDLQSDETETATLSLTEATSSGDEGSNSYSKGERGATAGAEIGKEESEDDRGDDLEFKLQGREASKQLIEEQRKTDALERQKIDADQADPSKSEKFRQEGVVSSDSAADISGGAAKSEYSEHIGENVSHTFCDTDEGLRRDRRPKSARDYLSDAAYASISNPYRPVFDFSEQGDTGAGKSPNRNGMLIHCLLNLAVGRQPIDKSGTAAALVAKAALSSLKRLVSGQEGLDAGDQFGIPRRRSLMRLTGGSPLEAFDNTAEKSILGGEWEIRQEQELVGDVLSIALSGGGSRSYGDYSYNDVKAIVPVSSFTNLVELDTDSRGDDEGDDKGEIRGDAMLPPPLLVESSPENFDVSTTLEVKNVEIRDDSVIVKVQGHLEVEKHGQSLIEEDDVVDTIVIARTKFENEVVHMRDQNGGNIEGSGYQVNEEIAGKILPERDTDITVKVDKHIVEELKAGLEDIDDEEGKPVSATHETTTTIFGEQVDLSSGVKEIARAEDNSLDPNVQDSMFQAPSVGLQASPVVGVQYSSGVGTQDPLVVGTQGQSTSGIQGNVGKSEGVEDEQTDGRTAFGKEMAMSSSMNAVTRSSPWQKAAVELETEWRHVVENAATLLNGAPYSSKKLGHSASQKKKSSSMSRSHEKQDASEEGPGQAERKSWGWLWGGNSGPQPKQVVDHDGFKDSKRKPSSVAGELPSASSEALLDQGSSVPDSEILTKRSESANQSSVEIQKVHVEADGGASDSGAESGRKDGKNVSQRGREDQLENTSNASAQQQPKRFFGLFGTRNPPSLPNASSPQRHDERPLLEGGASESADIEDIFDQKWAKSNHANHGLLSKAAPQLELPVPKMTEDAEDLGDIAEGSDPPIVEVVGEKNETTEPEIHAGPSGDVRDSPNGHENHSPPLEETMRRAATPPAIDGDANSAFSRRLCEQVVTTVTEAENTIASDVQLDSGNHGNWSMQSQSDTVRSDTKPNGPNPISTTDVVILSVDGCIIAAPIDDNAEAEAPEVSQGEQDYPSSADGENQSNARKSPQRAVCFADPPELIEEKVDESDAKQSLSNGAHALASSDREDSEFSGIISVGSGAGGLKLLAKVTESEGLEGAKHSSNIENKEDIRSTLESSTVMGEPADDLTATYGANSREMETQTDPFYISKVADDGDSPDSSERGMERYYSSKDLIEIENQERKPFRRNLSVYLDAVGDENDEYAAEDEGNGASEKTDPINIPGAVGRARTFSPSSDPPPIRTAESLPNERHGPLSSDMGSPRLAVSRSLDSASSSALLGPDRSEVSSSTIQVSPEAKGTFAAGIEAVSKNSQTESKPAKAGKLESQRQTKATGFELSLCRHLLKEKMGVETAAEAFAIEQITLDLFKESGSAIAANDKLVVRVGDQYYPWIVAAPIVLGILAFGQVLVSPEGGAIPVEKPTVTFDGKGPTSPLITAPSSGWNFWPFGSTRRPKTPEKENLADSVSKDELALEVALKTTVTKEYLQMANYYLRPTKIKTNTPSSQQLASLHLKEGSNKITFTFVTRLWGKQQVDARIYLWKSNTRIVISDVDGTITKSDVLGQVMPLVGKDWTQSGVARLFSAIKRNGYELMFLSARAISQAHLTRQFLENIKQDGEVLPDGPVVISPDGLFPSLFREVIRRAPHEFKIACLQDIKSLFPAHRKPFYAGFGNRDTDELSYLKVGIVKGKIFTINPKGEVVVNNRIDIKSYTSLHKLVDDMFPAMTTTEQEDYNDVNFWRLPLPDIEDELSTSSVSHNAPKKGVKSGKG